MGMWSKFSGAALMLAPVLAACGTPATEEPVAEPIIAFAQVDPNLVEHGERLSLVLGCSGCHGKDLAGRDWSDELGTLWTANLTRSAAAHSDAELAAMITTGARPDRDLWEMPSHLFTQLAPGDLASVIAYLRSRPVAGEVHPPPMPGEVLKAEMAKGEYSTSRATVAEEGQVWPPKAGAEHALGRYIVRATCAECHTMQLRGGSPPFPGAAPRPDLRIAASYERADFVRLLREGVAAGDRELGLMGEVARGRYRHLTDAEIAAVHNYLAALAQIDP